MQVQPIRNNNTNFGMALNIDRAGINKHFTNDVVEVVEMASPALESMAKNVNIILKPYNFAFGPLGKSKDSLCIEVREQNVSFINKLKSTLGLRHPYKRAGVCFADEMRFGLLEDVVEKFKKDIVA